MKSHSISTMNETVSDIIAAAVQALTFFHFFGGHLFSIDVRILSIIIVSESSDRYNATHDWGPRKSRFAIRVIKATKSQEGKQQICIKGSAKQEIWKKGSRKQKVLATLI